MSMLALLPLLGKKLTDLSVDDLNLVSKELGINVQVTEQMRVGALLLAKDGDLDSVADLIKSPEQIKSFVNFFKNQAVVNETHKLVSCPHCQNFHLI